MTSNKRRAVQHLIKLGLSLLTGLGFAYFIVCVAYKSIESILEL
jgi:hypothetical protein